MTDESKTRAEERARCVAAVERVETEAIIAVDSLKGRDCRTRQEEDVATRAVLAQTQFLAGVRACLQALCEGSK